MIPALADSADGAAAIPAVFRRSPNAVMAYADGEFAWPPASVDLFPRHISITVLGEPMAAWHSREIDVEHGAATVEDVPDFIAERRRIGHDDGTAYCDRSTLGELLDHARAAGVTGFRLHIATLDDTYRTPAQLAAELEAVEHVLVDPAAIWAIQWARRGRYDESAVFGRPDFDHRPVPKP